jgi:hypothetical protein
MYKVTVEVNWRDVWLNERAPVVFVEKFIETLPPFVLHLFVFFVKSHSVSSCSLYFWQILYVFSPYFIPNENKSEKELYLLKYSVTKIVARQS